jgi:tRNA G18 (ribose-2'-O)-methylase SpoU
VLAKPDPMRKLRVDELGRLNQQEFQAKEKQDIVIVLDNVRSGLNVGSVFRTADAFAIARVLLCGITPKPPHREILKTALGATESVAWEYHPTAASAVRSLLDLGYKVWPVEQTDQSILLDQVTAEKKIAVIFGNEVTGVSDEVVAMFNESIEIPQFGTKHSLNVAVSAGIVLWHLLYGK